MSARTAQDTYTIKEAAALTGLPASTLRYYESIGVIAPTSMSVSDMRQYVTNGELGPSAAGAQIELLEAQQQRLALEADHVALRRRYVRLKVDYWRAVDAGDTERAELVASEARVLADDLKRAKQQ